MANTGSNNIKTPGSITKDRKRTNLLRGPEQALIAFLVKKIPAWISSDMLTVIGLLGSVVVATSLYLATRINSYYLLLGILGFAISWFGDSLDGRMAYYRKIPRKWYGTTLDITIDWIGVVIMAFGFMLFLEDHWKYVAFFFAALYGWEMITAVLRFKVTGVHSIDSGIFGPTEVRIVLCLVLLLELFFPGSIKILSALAIAGLFVSNILEFRTLLKAADARDLAEKKK